MCNLWQLVLLRNSASERVESLRRGASKPLYSPFSYVSFGSIQGSVPGAPPPSSRRHSNFVTHKQKWILFSPRIFWKRTVELFWRLHASGPPPPPKKSPHGMTLAEIEPPHPPGLWPWIHGGRGTAGHLQSPDPPWVSPTTAEQRKAGLTFHFRTSSPESLLPKGRFLVANRLKHSSLSGQLSHTESLVLQLMLEARSRKTTVISPSLLSVQLQLLKGRGQQKAFSWDL